MNPQEPTITVQTLKDLLVKNRENVLLLDVRSKEEFETQHIPGAVNVPATELKGIVQEAIKTGKTLVTICNHGGNRSQNAAKALLDMGAKDSQYLQEGTAGWYDEESAAPSIH